MKIVVAPDKFKGSLTAFEVCEAVKAGIRRADKNIETVSCPLADGGDGFAAVMKYYLHTDTVPCPTVDPLNRTIDASYQWNEKTKTAIIEMAVASGLVLLTKEERNPLQTSTFGTGLLIKDAIARGAVHIILGLGGSATNDGGTGILEALGFQLLDEDNRSLKGNGASLGTLKKIIPPPLATVNFEIACDVQNVLYGPTGASYIYGPQKGASPQQVEVLDRGLKNLAGILFQQTGIDVSPIKGVGAAGGIAASLIPFFSVELKSGIDMILSVSDIGNALQQADLVITGEGKIDRQSMDGKVIGRVAELAIQNGIPVVAVCGKLDLDAGEIGRTGLTNVYVIGELLSVEESMREAGRLVEEKMKEITSSAIFRGWWRPGRGNRGLR